MAKRQFNYIKAMQGLKGKVNFNYRNQRNDTLSAGRKAAIRRAWNDLQQLKSTEIIKPPRKKGESQSHYRKRVSALKSKYGQKTALNGIAVAVPPNGKARFKGDQLIIEKKGSEYREEIVPITNPADFAQDPSDFIRDMILEKRPDAVAPFHTHWRSNKSARFFYDDSSFLDEAIDDFIGEVESILNQYKGNQNVMTGFMLMYNMD